MPGAVVEINVAAKSVSTPDGAQRVVLRNVRFSADAGEFLALFGPSGIGKSTALRLVLALDPDFEGSLVRPQGRVGAVFQEPRLLPWLTIEDNLRLVLTERRQTIDVARLLAEVELPGIERRWPHELSLGMARRVALARALAIDPDVLVLDEPFASLDPALAARLAALVSNWARRRGATVLLATHDLEQALGIADRILILAGEPATLAADLAVPPGSDLAAVAELRASLVAQFQFLARAQATE
jgi:NitT/TauT family transport system ATP-binding protein